MSSPQSAPLRARLTRRQLQSQFRYSQYLITKRDGQTFLEWLKAGAEHQSFTETCGTCLGCGEGRHEGARCWTCKGRGEVSLLEPEQDDEPRFADDDGGMRFSRTLSHVRSSQAHIVPLPDTARASVAHRLAVRASACAGLAVAALLAVERFR
ncbi:hypothetical protein [Variovorax sp. dw_954]|uniref:hypothetical protein n=1 Tax=Variovorax sp. dw_954 TaxID=2720078 RepID=UPI001BD34FAF|nr:hypothetical protein [Variovorax sp. dw_954]